MIADECSEAIAYKILVNPLWTMGLPHKGRSCLPLCPEAGS